MCIYTESLSNVIQFKKTLMERNYKIGTASDVKHSASKPPKDIQLSRIATKVHDERSNESHIKESSATPPNHKHPHI